MNLSFFTDLRAKASEALFHYRQKKRQEAIDKETKVIKPEKKKAVPDKGQEKPPAEAVLPTEEVEEKKPLLRRLLQKKEAQKEKGPKERRKIKEKRRARLKFHLDLAGIEKEPQKVIKELLIGAAILDLAVYFYLSFKVIQGGSGSIGYLFGLLIIFLTLGFLASGFIVWTGFYGYIDVRVYQRKIEIEKVLPDFLQLASANIKSGMPIDKALWLAVRPRFGVLAKEIETVAKQTMTGSDLEEALKWFADKYDSMTLKRSISLIIEGLRSGGEIGDLLYRISSDIQDTEILKKEMAASLTTYVIFITFATVLAAPFLFGLASQLLSIVQQVTGSIDMPDTSSGIGISISSSGIDQGDFRIFAMTMLSVTSFFSALIIATIQKGDIKAGLKYIPIFIITTIVLFQISSWGLGKVFEGMF